MMTRAARAAKPKRIWTVPMAKAIAETAALYRSAPNRAGRLVAAGALMAMVWKSAESIAGVEAAYCGPLDTAQAMSDVVATRRAMSPGGEDVPSHPVADQTPGLTWLALTDPSIAPALEVRDAVRDDIPWDIIAEHTGNDWTPDPRRPQTNLSKAVSQLCLAADPVTQGFTQYELSDLAGTGDISVGAWFEMSEEVAAANKLQEALAADATAQELLVAFRAQMDAAQRAANSCNAAAAEEYLALAFASESAYHTAAHHASALAQDLMADPQSRSLLKSSDIDQIQYAIERSAATPEAMPFNDRAGQITSTMQANIILQREQRLAEQRRQQTAFEQAQHEQESEDTGMEQRRHPG